MAIFLGYKTAELVLNSAHASEFLPTDETPAQCGFVDDLAAQQFDASKYGLPVDKPLDIVVGSRKMRRRRKTITCHVSSMHLPHGAYLTVAPDVFVASPALCLLQLSSSLTYAGRIKLAARFCGTYAPSKSEKHGFITRDALAAPEDLISFYQQLPRSRGRALALEAARWALPKAASPMETKMALPFYLPWQRGGFGFPRPTMNYELTLSARGTQMTGKGLVKVDMYWPDAGFGCEYQSEAFHKGDEKYGQDIGRQLAIESQGKTIRMVTLEQLRNPAQLEYLAGLVAAHLGVEFRPQRGRARRAELIADILQD